MFDPVSFSTPVDEFQLPVIPNKVEYIRESSAGLKLSEITTKALSSMVLSGSETSIVLVI